MKEKIYTIPMMDAFKQEDECPFCYLEKEAEEHALNYILGSQCAYMQDDIREQTDKKGFCRHHYKMMYDFGNRLGSALMLSSHMKKLMDEITREMEAFTPPKSSFGDRFKKGVTTQAPAETNLGQYLDAREKSCYICDHFNSMYDRYVDTFFHMYKKMPEFASLFKNSKGFCLTHFRDLVEIAATKLNDAQKKEFYDVLFSMMKENLQRVEADVNRYVDKLDAVRGQNLDWGEARDAVPRAMQKLEGGYPSAPVFQMKK